MECPANAEFCNWHPAYGDGRDILMNYVTFTHGLVSEIRLFHVVLEATAGGDTGMPTPPRIGDAATE